jgi:hypothetical protein
MTIAQPDEGEREQDQLGQPVRDRPLSDSIVPIPASTSHVSPGPGRAAPARFILSERTVARHHGPFGKELFRGLRPQAALRRTSQTDAAMRIAARAISHPASMNWKVQNRLAGWYEMTCV